MENLRSKNLCICHYFPSPQNGLALALLARHALLSTPQPAYLQYFLQLLFDLAAFLAGYLCLYPVFYLPFFAFNLPVCQLFSSAFLLGLFHWHKKPVHHYQIKTIRPETIPLPLQSGIYPFIIDKKPQLWSIAVHG